MRQLIDVYGKGSDGFTYLMGGLQQIGTPSVQCKPLMKTFTMSDGSIAAYATGAGTDNMNIEIECSLSDANRLQIYARSYGSLVFAGLHHMRSSVDRSAPAASAGEELFFTNDISKEVWGNLNTFALSMSDSKIT